MATTEPACTAERRESVRMSAAYPVEVFDRRGTRMARGRTSNISESGIFMLVSARRAPDAGAELVVRITVPTLSNEWAPRSPSRTVVYACRVVHRQPVGSLVGLGLQFLKKLS